jgi:hypothetical protein
MVQKEGKNPVLKQFGISETYERHGQRPQAKVR